MFEFLDKRLKNEYNDDSKALDILMSDLGLTKEESIMIYNNYKTKWLNRDGDIVGDNLDFYGTYMVQLNIPVTVEGRGFLNGSVEVVASSIENAKEKINNLDLSYDSIEIDENSYIYKKLDDLIGGFDIEIADDILDDILSDIALEEIKLKNENKNN